MQLSPQPKTESRTSMPRRGDRPGFKRKGNLRYWIARQVARDPMGFPDRCIRLREGADDAEINRLCQEPTGRLMAWIDEQRSGKGTSMPCYDGTVYSACQVYQKHPYSPFHGVSHKTRTSAYLPSLKVLEKTVGKR